MEIVETSVQVMDNIEDAIRLHIEDRLANNEEIPNNVKISLATLEVQV